MVLGGQIGKGLSEFPKVNDDASLAGLSYITGIGIISGLDGLASISEGFSAEVSC